jgi:hypothetical protein
MVILRGLVVDRILMSLLRAKGMPNSDKMKCEAILSGYEEIEGKSFSADWEESCHICQ